MSGQRLYHSLLAGCVRRGNRDAGWTPKHRAWGRFIVELLLGWAFWVILLMTLIEIPRYL